MTVATLSARYRERFAQGPRTGRRHARQIRPESLVRHTTVGVMSSTWRFEAVDRWPFRGGWFQASFAQPLRSSSPSASLRPETRCPGVRSMWMCTCRDLSSERSERGCWPRDLAVEEVAANLRPKRQQPARMARRAGARANDCGHDQGFESEGHSRSPRIRASMTRCGSSSIGDRDHSGAAHTGCGY